MHLEVFIVVAQGKRRQGEEEGGLKIITWGLSAAGPALSYFQSFIRQPWPPKSCWVLRGLYCAFSQLESQADLPFLLLTSDQSDQE